MKDVTDKQFFFEDFAVDVERRVLLKQGKIVSLKPKTFDLLVVLVERRGEIISKNDLLDAVWVNQFVEEKNLSVHVAALRKVFGEGKNDNRFIVTVPGTGYKFVAELNVSNKKEFLFENQTFKRITIQEEIEEVNINKVKGNPTLTRKFAIYLIPLFFCLLFIGFFVWKNTQYSNRTKPSSVKRLTTNGKVQIAVLSPDGKLFAYVMNDLGKSSLWLGYTSGGNDIQLRQPSEAIYSQISFSPDSNHLYFSSQEDQNQQTALYRMAVFGGGKEKISDGIEGFFLSPDGTQIAFARFNQTKKTNSLIVASINGKDEHEVFLIPKSKSFVFESISWSPDGKRLAFYAEGDDVPLNFELFILEISSGEIERTSMQGWRQIGTTTWLKSGEGLVFTAIPEKSYSSVENFQVNYLEFSSGKIREITNDLSTYNSYLSVSDDSNHLLTVEHRQLNNLWVAPTDSLSEAKQITFGSFGKYDGLWGLDWTPDGRIVFTNSDTESQVISVMNADGSDHKELTPPGFIDSALTVSNDGRFVVFHSNRGGGFDIWRMDIDGGNLKQLTFGARNYHPSVSSDNRYVYYKSWMKDVGELQRVPADGGEPEILTDKETGWSSFSPDGKFFAATYRTDKRRIAVFSVDTNQIIKQFDVPKTSIFNMRLRWTPDSLAVIYRDSAYGYWRQSIEGGEPQRLDGLPKEKFFTYAYSMDGKYFAFVRGQEIRDVILINRIR